MKKTALFFTLIPPLVGFIVILLIMNSYQYFKIKDDFATTLIQEFYDSELASLRSFFTAIEEDLHLIRDWGKNEILFKEDITRLNKQLFPLFQQQEMISAIILANDEGQEYFLYRNIDSYLTRTLSSPTTPGLFHWQQWLQPDNSVKRWQQESSYDPRKRSWFIHSESKRIVWSSIYTFFHADTPGVTASIRWQCGKTSSKICVAAADIPLKNIKKLLLPRDAPPSTLLFLANPQKNIFLTGNIEDTTGQSDRSGDGLKKLSAHLVKLLTDNAAGGRQSIPFDHQGEKWFSVVQEAKPEHGEFQFGIAAPEKELLQLLGRELLQVDGIDLTLATLGSLLMFVLIWKSGRLQLQKSVPPESRLISVLNRGEGARVEFKSTIRKNLKTGKHGKEIELAWLKAVGAFLNMSGGTLLLGVKDSGEIAGLKEDEFENIDKALLHVKNLLNQHIGAEYSAAISTTPIQVEEYWVIMVECGAVETPVFLKIGKNEEFYVRSGPSSIKLTPSQMASFILQNKS